MSERILNLTIPGGRAQSAPLHTLQLSKWSMESKRNPAVRTHRSSHSENSPWKKSLTFLKDVRVGFVISLLLTASLASIFVMPVSATLASINVSPSNITVYQSGTFSANVTISNVSNLAGWEFQLCWNRSVINCTNAEIRGPSEWHNSNVTVGPGLQHDYNATHGRFHIGFALLYPASVFNGSTTLVAFTFEAMETGTVTLQLVETLLADNSKPMVQPIDHASYDGSVTVLPPPLYMRSDQHTVNNATMYKLMETHTGNWNVTSKSSLDPEDEWVGYWGIRVWKRSNNGSESEISSGSPVAVVSRSFSGQGLQSANWTCPATNLSITDSLVVRVYYKFDVDSYTLCAEFSTVQLNATSLAGQTWTVYYYTQRSYNSQQHKTYIYYYWDNTYGSRIENVDYF